MTLKIAAISLITVLCLIILLSFMFSKAPIAMSNSLQPRLHYLVRKPKIETDKAPMLLLLHGVGSNEQNMFSFADAMPDNFLVVSARGPIAMNQNSYAWFQVQFTAEGPVINKSQAEQSRQDLLAFIEELKAVEDFDATQIYLLGFSQGGIMSYSTYLTEPEKIKGIAVMSGRLLHEVRPLIASDDRLRSAQIFVSHGIQDRVLNYNYAIEATDYLKSKGITPVFHSYNEDHTISWEMMQDVAQWLQQSTQTKVVTHK